MPKKVNDFPSISDLTNIVFLMGNTVLNSIIKITPQGVIDFLKSAFYTKAEVDSRVASNFAGTVDTLTFNPGTPVSNIIYRANAGAGTYTNFLRAASTPIAVTTGDGQVDFIFNTTTGFWKKISSPQDLTNYTKTVDFAPVLDKTSVLSNNYNDNYALPIADANGKFLGGFRKDGSFEISKYLAGSIPASVLKPVDITLSNFAAGLVAYIAKSTDLAPIKTFYDNSIDDVLAEGLYIYAIVDASRRLLLGIKKDGTAFLKLDPAQIQTILTGYVPVDMPTSSGYLWSIVDSANRFLIGVKSDGTFDFKNGSVGLSKLGADVFARWSPLNGKKLVMIGDSLVERRYVQPVVCTLTGLVWNTLECVPGVGANPGMGVGGSKIAGEIEEITPGSGTYVTGRAPTQSIYYRAGFIQNYSPDVIILRGGTNDHLPDTFDINDAPYTGAEIMYTATGKPSLVSWYKGTLLKILTNNPAAKVYTMTRLPANDGSTLEDQFAYIEKLNAIIRAVSKMYGVHCIDTASKTGITKLNASTFYEDTIHYNPLGAAREAAVIAKEIC